MRTIAMPKGEWVPLDHCGIHNVVGMRVRATITYGYVGIGMLGTILAVTSTNPRVAVEFDTLRTGHDCDGRCPSPRGYYVSENRLEVWVECEQ